MIGALAFALSATLAAPAPAVQTEMSYYCTAEHGTSVAYASAVVSGPWGQTQLMQDRWKTYLDRSNKPYDFSSLNCRGFEGADAYARNAQARDASEAYQTRYKDMGYQVETQLGQYDLNPNY